MTKILNRVKLQQMILTYIGVTALEHGIDEIPLYRWNEIIEFHCWYDVTVSDCKDAAKQALADYHNEIHNRII